MHSGLVSMRSLNLIVSIASRSEVCNIVVDRVDKLWLVSTGIVSIICIVLLMRDVERCA